MASSSHFMTAATIIVLATLLKTSYGSRVGVCYGMLGNDLPKPSEVVALYKQHKIDKMRLYYPDQNALHALRGSNIKLILDVPREELKSFANSPDKAGDWVGRNIMLNWPDVRFKYIGVGNEVIPRVGSEHILPAMKNIYNAIAAAGLQNKIKVSTVIDTGVLSASYPPSAGTFSSKSKKYLAPIVQFLSSINAPLLCNVYPFFAYTSNPTDISLDYALFRESKPVVPDGQLQYRNLFDAIVDSIHAAIEKVNGQNVGIVISETGWPWKGGFGASLDNAGSYNWHIINHVHGGTPKKPGPLETYIFAMFNENEKKGKEIEKYFGLFYPNKQPVYPLEF